MCVDFFHSEQIPLLLLCRYEYGFESPLWIWFWIPSMNMVVNPLYEYGCESPLWIWWWTSSVPYLFHWHFLSVDFGSQRVFDFIKNLMCILLNYSIHNLQFSEMKMTIFLHLWSFHMYFTIKIKVYDQWYLISCASQKEPSHTFESFLGRCNNLWALKGLKYKSKWPLLFSQKGLQYKSELPLLFGQKGLKYKIELTHLFSQKSFMFYFLLSAEVQQPLSQQMYFRSGFLEKIIIQNAQLTECNKFVCR